MEQLKTILFHLELFKHIIYQLFNFHFIKYKNTTIAFGYSIVAYSYR